MSQTPNEPETVSPDEVCAWLRTSVAVHVHRPAEEIRADLPLSEYGLDSVYVLSICADAEDHYGIEIDSTLLWDHPRLDSLSEALAPLINSRQAAPTSEVPR